MKLQTNFNFFFLHCVIWFRWSFYITWSALTAPSPKYHWSFLSPHGQKHHLTVPPQVTPLTPPQRPLRWGVALNDTLIQGTGEGQDGPPPTNWMRWLGKSKTMFNWVMASTPNRTLWSMSSIIWYCRNSEVRSCSLVRRVTVPLCEADSPVSPLNWRELEEGKAAWYSSGEICWGLILAKSSNTDFNNHRMY